MPRAPSARWADLQDRLLSAAVLIPIAAIAIYLGGLAIALMVAAMLAGAYHEWERMLSGGRFDWRGRALTGLLALVPIAYVAAGFWAGVVMLVLTVGFAGIALEPERLARYRVPGVAFLGFAGLALLAIRGSETPNLAHMVLSGPSAAGVWVGAFLAAVIWLTDSGAFFTGRLVGGAKLSPDISPSKTWAGAIGGLVVATAGGVVVWWLVTDSPLWVGLAIGAMVSVLAQLGDLAESAIKRRFMVKDSGDIFPGHGGVLDRIDSFTVGGIGLFMIGTAHAGLDAVAAGVLYW
jgi:phosphatidate cytidylyltransferase